MASFRDDEEAMNNQISCRLHVYKACIRFTTYLIREGLKNKDELETYKEEKPFSRYKPQRDWLEADEVKAAIDFNKK